MKHVFDIPGIVVIIDPVARTASVDNPEGDIGGMHIGLTGTPLGDILLLGLDAYLALPRPRGWYASFSLPARGGK
jgi:hypothetical protein